MSRRRTLAMGLALALVAIAGPLVAQEEPAARFGERIQVTEVLLDVLVTDADGNPVLGLDAGDFVVEEDGQPVELGSVTFYGSSALLDAPALGRRLQPTGSAAEGRFFILFFDDVRLRAPILLRQQRDAATQARRWIEQSLLPIDWVAVVSYYNKLRVHQDFTQDRELLGAALDSVSRGKDPGATWSAAALLGEAPSLTRHLPQGKKLRKETPLLEEALEVLANAAVQTKGRKNLVFFSIGFGEVDRFGWRPDQRYYPRTRRALNDANVAVYSIGLAGNALLRDPVIEALGNSLSQLSVDTGGVHYQSFASFAVPLREVGEDNGGYYLLSYAAEYPAGDRGYRKVNVKTTSPKLRVRARDGYLFGG